MGNSCSPGCRWCPASKGISGHQRPNALQYSGPLVAAVNGPLAGCNSADDGSDVALTPTDRRRPANGPTYYMFFNKQLISYRYFFT